MEIKRVLIGTADPLSEQVKAIKHVLRRESGGTDAYCGLRGDTFFWLRMEDEGNVKYLRNLCFPCLVKLTAEHVV